MSRTANRIVFITRSRYWDIGAGLWARSRAMLAYLSRYFSVSVVYFGKLGEGDAERLRRVGFAHRMVAFDPLVGDGEAAIRQLRRYVASAPPADVYLVDKTELSCLLPALPPGALRIVDTHDLVSQRSARAAAYGVADPLPLTAHEEAALLDRYDGIICIQANEYETVKRWVDPGKVVPAPHPVTAVRRAARAECRTIGFVASGWHANVDGLRWFLERVMPLLEKSAIELGVCGYVCNALAAVTDPRIVSHGLVADLDGFYAGVDVMINPVRYGAGLKIKSVEALAHGLPLVTTGEGASGLETLAGKALLVADTPAEFAAALRRLVEDRALRERLGTFGSTHAERAWSTDACLGPVLDFIRRRLAARGTLRSG